MLLALLESPPWVGYNESDLKFFRPKVWEKLNFELFCHWDENPSKLQKLVFEVKITGVNSSHLGQWPRLH
jgi:hypothetical protein